MADERIDSIIGKQAFDEVERLEAGLKGLVDTFIKSSNAAKLLEAALLKETTIKGVNNAIKSQKAALSDLDKQVKEMEAAKARLAKAESDHGKALAATAIEIQKQNTANKNAARESQAADDSVNKMSATLIRLRNQYDALSKAEREGAKGKGLLGNIQALDIELKAIDGSLGRFSRNVGNYGMVADQLKNHLASLTAQFRNMDAAMRVGPQGLELERSIKSTTNAIQLLNAQTGPATANTNRYANATMSLSQVFREIPAFTYSAQTGILGISNNLPILADQFKAVSKEVNATTGKINGTVGALKIFAESIFSMGNIFTIALGLFTIFSKQIFEFFSGTKKATEATNDLAKAIGTETGKFEGLVRQLDNHNLSTKERLRAAKELKDMYPTALNNYSLEEIAAGKAADAIMRIKDALIAVAMARAAQTDLDKLAGKLYENGKKIADKRAQLITKTALLDKTKSRRGEGQIGSTGISAGSEEYGRAYQSVVNLVDGIRDLEKENRDLENQMNRTADAIGRFNTQANKGGISGDGKDMSKGGKTPKSKESLTKPEINPNLSDTDLADLKAYYENLRRAQVDALGEMVGDPESMAAFEKFLIGDLDNPISDEAAKDLANSLEEWSKKKADDLAIKLQLKVDTERFVKEFEIIVGIVQTATDMLGVITDIQYNREMMQIDNREKRQQEIYDAELKRINSSYTNQSDKARELAKIEAVREAQQKRIDRDRISADRKRAQQQKAYDIANITTSTALAVIKAYTEGDPFTKVARAILAGAAGTVSLAKAVAAPIPQYAKGTDNHPGGFALVGEAGTERVNLPDGTSFLTNGPTIMDLPKRTEVISNQELMAPLMALAYKKLGNGNVVTTDALGEALIESFEENTTEIKLLRKDIKESKTSVSIQGNFDHYIHVQNNIR